MLSITASMRESDVDDLIKEVEEIIHDNMEALSKKIDSTWRDKAGASTRTSKDKYLAGLTVAAEGDKVTATLLGWLPVAVEMGKERWQMNAGLTKEKVVALIGKDGGEARFRLMKPGSPGWWHPAIIARKIHQQVFSELESTILPAVFTAPLSRRSV